MAPTGLKGMNVEEGEKLASSCSHNSGTILQLTKDLTRQLSDTEWYGNDATTFRSAWETQYSKALTNVAQALENASSHLKKEVAAQRQASGE